MEQRKDDCCQPSFLCFGPAISRQPRFYNLSCPTEHLSVPVLPFLPFIEPFYEPLFKYKEFLKIHQDVIQYSSAFEFFPVHRQVFLLHLPEYLLKFFHLLIRCINLYHKIYQIHHIIGNNLCLLWHRPDPFHLVMQIM